MTYQGPERRTQDRRVFQRRRDSSRPEVRRVEERRKDESGKVR